MCWSRRWVNSMSRQHAGRRPPFRERRARLGIRQHSVVVVACVLPFLVFAAEIALGSAWATWH